MLCKFAEERAATQAGFVGLTFTLFVPHPAIIVITVNIVTGNRVYIVLAGSVWIVESLVR
jgi:hypothetical protein